MMLIDIFSVENMRKGGNLYMTIQEVVGTSPQKRTHLNIKKTLFAVGVTEHWNRLLREVVESSSVMILKGHLDMVLGKQL